LFKRSIVSLTLMVAVLVPMFAASPAGAQEDELSIGISPEGGAADSIVTISGSGAPANAEVIVSQAVWVEGQDCRAPRGGETIETVTAGEDGEFSATHTAEQIDPSLAGYTYFAYIPTEEAPQPRSNLQCFPFDFDDDPNARQFDETGHWVTDRFLEFWDNNGGLPIFGYPLTDDSVEDGRTTQYFERQRFELHPDNERPFDVLLGHLGRQAAEERDLLDSEAFQPAEEGSTGDDCRYFEQTGHNVCHGFLNYFDSYGLNLGDEGVSERESVMLFGYPISEAFEDPETGMTVQYFERAKLEYHPENEEPWDVIPERLGARLFDR
jgi:hypothetical protein